MSGRSVLLGRALRRLLPEDHLTADSRDTIKLAMGLVATMTALVLGLLVSSAKGGYDTKRSEVIQIAANVAFLDRLLALYGPEAAEARTSFHKAVQEAVRQMWPGEMGVPAQLAPNTQAGNAVFTAVQGLSPHDDTQRKLKEQATTLATGLGQLRSLLVAQAAASISMPMLIILVSWLIVIFLGFSVLAPPNATVIFCFNDFGSRCGWRHFPDPGAGSALCWANPDFQRANARRSTPVRKMRSMET